MSHLIISKMPCLFARSTSGSAEGVLLAVMSRSVSHAPAAVRPFPPIHISMRCTRPTLLWISRLCGTGKHQQVAERTIHRECVVSVPLLRLRRRRSLVIDAQPCLDSESKWLDSMISCFVRMLPDSYEHCFSGMSPVPICQSYIKFPHGVPARCYMPCFPDSLVSSAPWTEPLLQHCSVVHSQCQRPTTPI